MNYEERVKILRKDYLNLSQVKFADKLGISASEVRNIEYKLLARPENKEPLIRLICTTFNVNYNWLKNGEGEIFSESKEDYINRLVTDYRLDNCSEQLIRTYLELEDEPRKHVEKFLLNFVENIVNNGKDYEKAFAKAVEDNPLPQFPTSAEYGRELTVEERIKLSEARTVALKGELQKSMTYERQSIYESGKPNISA